MVLSHNGAMASLYAMTKDRVDADALVSLARQQALSPTRSRGPIFVAWETAGCSCPPSQDAVIETTLAFLERTL